MNQKKIFFYLSFLAALFITACSDTDNPIDDDRESTHALLVLNEGGMNQNNSTLARYDLIEENLEKNYFRSVNNRELGDTGNDMLLYGSKLYIVVTGSSTVEVVKAATGESLGQIQMKEENETGGKQPRQIAAHDGKVYVTSFDDTVTRIDTTTFAKDGSLQVGYDPDGIVIANNKIYVANSGGLGWSPDLDYNYDTSVSVIDITTFQEEKKIEVGENPVNLGADSQGNIYVSLMGVYGVVPPSFKRIDRITGDVTTIDEVESPGKFVISNNKAYIITSEENKVVVYDCQQGKIESETFITDNTLIENFIYSISVDHRSGDVFITETDYVNPGNIYCFDKAGKLKYNIPTIGLNPGKAIVVR